MKSYIKGLNFLIKSYYINSHLHPICGVSRASQVAIAVRIHLPMQVRSLGQEDPLSRKWQPAPIFLPGECHGQKSLAVQGVPEGDRTRQNCITIFE